MRIKIIDSHFVFSEMYQILVYYLLLLKYYFCKSILKVNDEETYIFLISSDVHI